MPGLKSPNEKKPKSRSCNLKKVIAKHSRTKCCCCIPIKPAFKWKDDTMYNCQDDIRYWVPSNSSTVTMPDDPNATTIQEVGDACEAATKLALIFYLVDYFLKFIFLIHFGRVVHSYSKVLFEEKIDNGEDREIEKIDLEDDDEKKDKQKNDIQTNLQQVDVNKYIFELPDAASINHIVVFLLGTIPFDPGYAATVHFLWPGSEGGWKLLGMLSNEKPSAIFRLRGFSTSKSTSTLAPNTNTPTFNPIKLIGNSTTSTDEINSSNTISATNGTIPNFDLINQITMNILKNLYNYVTSFATTSIPFGSDAIGAGDFFLSLKSFQDWYDSYTRKVKMDPNKVLKGDNPM
ncbi:6497_t:CDS:2 [Entrophospora sp. SA101]|nr:6497_t:CDS:2 [Entrophospora sp. SA101]